MEQNEEVLLALPSTEMVLVGRDLSSLDGKTAEPIERAHGGFRHGFRNTEGK